MILRLIKERFPFYELDHNPLNSDIFNPEDWVAVPLSVGKWLIIAYIHKSRGCIEMTGTSKSFSIL